MRLCAVAASAAQHASEASRSAHCRGTRPRCPVGLSAEVHCAAGRVQNGQPVNKTMYCIALSQACEIFFSNSLCLLVVGRYSREKAAKEAANSNEPDASNL